jgi:hypothetical protein
MQLCCRADQISCRAGRIDRLVVYRLVVCPIGPVKPPQPDQGGLGAASGIGGGAVGGAGAAGGLGAAAGAGLALGPGLALGLAAGTCSAGPLPRLEG